MKIEDITPGTLRTANDSELKNLRFRFGQIYKRYCAEGKPEADAAGIPRPTFMTKYVQLRVEMQRRGIQPVQETELDGQVQDRIAKKAVWNLDTAGLAPIIVAENFAAITGDFLRDPKGAKDLQVVLKTAARDQAIETTIGHALTTEIGKGAFFSYDEAGPAGAHIPIYDLVLRPRPMAKKATGRPGAGKPVAKKLTESEQADFDAETARIRESATKPAAKARHKFQPAKWTASNGHPRCLVCGDDEPTGGICNAPARAAAAELEARKAAGSGDAAATQPVATQAELEAMIARQKAREAETSKIYANRKTQEARGRHKYTAAVFPDYEGRERCLICDGHKPITGECPGTEAGWRAMEAATEQPAPALADIGKAGEAQQQDPEPADPAAFTAADQAEAPDGQAYQVTSQAGRRVAFFKSLEDARAYAGQAEDAREPALAEAPPDLELQKFDIAKPETTAAYHRIPVLPIKPGAKLRTITLTDEQGIKAIEDTDAHKIVTYLLSTAKWTMAEAKAWVDDHKPGKKAKTEKAAAAPARAKLLFRFTKKDEEKQVVGGLIYEPHVVDTQGDFTDEKEIEAAMYRFMEAYAKQQNRVKVMHRGKPYFFPVLECFQAEADTKKGGQPLKKGAWYMTIKVTHDPIWKDIKGGKLNGFSMGGRARSF